MALLGTTFTTFNVSVYRYLRWQITTLRNTTQYTQASEFRITQNGSDVSISGTTVTNPGGSSPSGETPPNLVDGSTSTKWLQLNVVPATVIFDFGTAKTFNGYRWATANDAVERDPITWTVSGSNDSSNWTQLHSVTNASITTSRNTFLSVFSF